MSFTYNFEESKPKLLNAREVAEEALARWSGPTKDNIMEMAAAVNAPTFTSLCQKACDNIDTVVKLYKDMIGQDGDEATDGTLCGAIKYVERGMAAMGLS